MDKITEYEVTIQAIKTVRKELGAAIIKRDKQASADAMDRVISLYASLDLDTLLKLLALIKGSL